MNVDQFLSTPCSVVTDSEDHGNPDAYGNPTVTAGVAVETVCWLTATAEAAQNNETTGVEDLQHERWSCYFPKDTEITGRSRVTVDGITYEVYGTPWVALNPIPGAVEFVAAQLVRTA